MRNRFGEIEKLTFVNVACVRQRWEREDGMPDIQSMMGNEVEVVANGIFYRGVLMEMTDNEVSLKSLMQWISLPVSAVNTVRIPGQIRREPEREGILSDYDRPI